MSETRRFIGASRQLQAPGNEPPTEFRLWEFGEVRARWAGGREETFVFDHASAESVMRDFRARGHDLSLDYNHAQFDERPRSDRDMRAAGSFELELRSDGLWMVNIQWTEDAANYVRRREYRYLSPTFDVDRKSRRIVALHNVALTPNPATLGALPLVASQGQPPPDEAGREDTHVDPEVIGLAATASPTEVTVRAAALHNFEQFVLTRLGAADRETATGKLEAVLAKAAQADQLAEQVEQLQTAAEDAERERLIEQALADRKLTPAQAGDNGWARTCPLATLKAYLQDAPTIIPGEIEDDGSGQQPPAETWETLSGPQKAWLALHDHDRYIALRKAALGR